MKGLILTALAVSFLGLLGAEPSRAETISFFCAESNGTPDPNSSPGCDFNDGSVTFSLNFPG